MSKQLLDYEEWKASVVILTPDEARVHYGDWFETHSDVEQYLVFNKGGSYDSYIEDLGYCFFIDIEGDWAHIRKDKTDKLEEYTKKLYEWCVYMYIETSLNEIKQDVHAFALEKLADANINANKIEIIIEHN